MIIQVALAQPEAAAPTHLNSHSQSVGIAKGPKSVRYDTETRPRCRQTSLGSGDWKPELEL